jgi:hypothetical protein
MRKSQRNSKPFHQKSRRFVYIIIIMKISYLLIVLGLLLVVACKKNGGSGLSLKLSSISNNIVPNGGYTTVVLSYTSDASSPLDTIFIHKIRVNQNQTETIRDTIFLAPPSYPGAVKGQISIDLDNTNYLSSAVTPPTFGNPPQNEPDSLILKIAVQDVSKRKSDTVTTGLIIVER